MGVVDDEFKRLQNVVTSLEERVKRLEQRQSGNAAAKVPEEGVRMILMGPPGAGTSRIPRDFFLCYLSMLLCSRAHARLGVARSQQCECDENATLCYNNQIACC